MALTSLKINMSVLPSKMTYVKNKVDIQGTTIIRLEQEGSSSIFP